MKLHNYGGDIVSRYRYRYTARDYAILRAYNNEVGKDVTILYKNGDTEVMNKKDAIYKIYNEGGFADNIRFTTSKMINKILSEIREELKNNI